MLQSSPTIRRISLHIGSGNFVISAVTKSTGLDKNLIHHGTKKSIYYYEKYEKDIFLWS
jgi:hypothetical protein